MANPFKESENRAKTKPKTVDLNPIETTTGDAEPVAKTVPKKDDTNPLEGKIEKKSEGKSCGFYLSSEAIAKLDELAKVNKCSKSKALDALLRNLL